MNINSPDAVGLSPLLIALRTCFIAFVGLLIISGNILSIAVTRRVSNLADSTKVLMTSLAVSDLLVGVISLFSVVASALDRWPLGDVGCKIFSIGMLCTFTLSITLIVFLNVERYIAVARPYQFPVWCSRHCIMTAVVVISALTLCTITGIQFGIPTQHYDGLTICAFANSSTIMNILNLLLFDVFPTLTITLVYYKVIKISRQHERRRVNPNSQNKENNLQANKALKTFLVVTLTFATSFTPLLVSRTVGAFKRELVPGWVQFITVWLSFSNSAFNVFIYCLFNRSYRQIAKRIISERFPRCTGSSVVPVDI